MAGEDPKRVDARGYGYCGCGAYVIDGVSALPERPLPGEHAVGFGWRAGLGKPDARPALRARAALGMDLAPAEIIPGPVRAEE